MGPIFRGVFWAVVFEVLFRDFLGFWFFLGVLNLVSWGFWLVLVFFGVRVYIKISVKRGEVGLKRVICRRSTN